MLQYTSDKPSNKNLYTRSHLLQSKASGMPQVLLWTDIGWENKKAQNVIKSI